MPLPNSCSNGYDIALLKLRQPLTFDDNVKVALPRSLPNPDIGTELMVAGWGLTSNDGQSGFSSRLKWVKKQLFNGIFMYALICWCPGRFGPGQLSQDGRYMFTLLSNLVRGLVCFTFC